MLQQHGYIIDDKIIYMLTRHLSQRIPPSLPIEHIIALVKENDIKLSVPTQKQILMALNMACSADSVTGSASSGGYSYGVSVSQSPSNSLSHNMTYDFFEMIVEQADKEHEEVDDGLWELFINSAAFKSYQTQSSQAVAQSQLLQQLQDQEELLHHRQQQQQHHQPKSPQQQQKSSATSSSSTGVNAATKSASPNVSPVSTDKTKSTLSATNTHANIPSSSLSSSSSSQQLPPQQQRTSLLNTAPPPRSTLQLTSFLSSKVMDILLGSKRSEEIKSLVLLLSAKSVRLDNDHFCLMMRKMMDKDNFAGAEELFNIILEQYSNIPLPLSSSSLLTSSSSAAAAVVPAQPLSPSAAATFVSAYSIRMQKLQNKQFNHNFPPKTSNNNNNNNNHIPNPIFVTTSPKNNASNNNNANTNDEVLSAQVLNLFATVFIKLNHDPAKQIRYLERIAEHIPFCYQDMSSRALSIYFKRACLLKLPEAAAMFFHAFTRVVDREGVSSMLMAKLCYEKNRPDLLLRLLDGWTPRRTVLLSFIGTVIASLASMGFWKTALHFEAVYIGK